MTHTLETLLPLLESNEGLERLRILAAEADGWILHYSAEWDSAHDEWSKDGEFKYPNMLPNYTTSLDAIFAAEERLGLHDRDNKRNRWLSFVEKMQRLQGVTDSYRAMVPFLTAAQRCIPFIITAQRIKKQKD